MVGVTFAINLVTFFSLTGTCSFARFAPLRTTYYVVLLIIAVDVDVLIKAFSFLFVIFQSSITPHWNHKETLSVSFYHFSSWHVWLSSKNPLQHLIRLELFPSNLILPFSTSGLLNSFLPCKCSTLHHL